jgi:hypothetical protein
VRRFGLWGGNGDVEMVVEEYNVLVDNVVVTVGVGGVVG